MPENQCNIVWLKRDLRLQDHAPLYAAENAALSYRIIYLFEPSLIAHPDTSLRHLQFIYQSLLALQKELAAYGRSVELLYGEAAEVFAYLRKRAAIKQLFSYQESGVQLTWDCLLYTSPSPRDS